MDRAEGMSREGKSREKALNIRYNVRSRWNGGCAVLECHLGSAGATLRRYPKSKGKGKAPERQ